MLKWPFRKSDSTPVMQADVKSPAPAVQPKAIVPQGWFVMEAGQSPVHMLWFAYLVNFDDLMKQNKSVPRHYFAEEFNSFDEALAEAVKAMEEGEKNIGS